MAKQPKSPVKTAEKKSFPFFDKLTERHLSLERIVAALMSAVLMAYIYTLLSHGNFAELSSYYNSISFVGFFAITILGFAALVGVTWLAKNRYIIPWALMLTAFAVSVLFAANYKDGGALFCVGVGVVDLIIVLWEVRGDKLGISGMG